MNPNTVITYSGNRDNRLVKNIIHYDKEKRLHGNIRRYCNNELIEMSRYIHGQEIDKPYFKDIYSDKIVISKKISSIIDGKHVTIKFSTERYTPDNVLLSDAKTILVKEKSKPHKLYYRDDSIEKIRITISGSRYTPGEDPPLDLVFKSDNEYISDTSRAISTKVYINSNHYLNDKLLFKVDVSKRYINMYFNNIKYTFAKSFNKYLSVDHLYEFKKADSIMSTEYVNGYTMLAKKVQDNGKLFVEELLTQCNTRSSRNANRLTAGHNTNSIPSTDPEFESPITAVADYAYIVGDYTTLKYLKENHHNSDHFVTSDIIPIRYKPKDILAGRLTNESVRGLTVPVLYLKTVYVKPSAWFSRP